MNQQTNLSAIRKLLLGGCKLTVLLVLRIVNTLELRHYLSILRKEGMIIKDEWKTTDDGKRFKVYWV